MALTEHGLGVADGVRGHLQQDARPPDGQPDDMTAPGFMVEHGFAAPPASPRAAASTLAAAAPAVAP